MGKNGRVRYDEEFKRNAVDLWIKSGKSVRVIAADLGVADVTLYEWRKKYLAEDGPLRQNLREENERLRREVHELRQERDILKKSVAIFLKPQK
ncbi:MAG: transposase [Leptospiraceae bacterium]|nr:transposase [Leptospiraceae bacterium]